MINPKQIFTWWHKQTLGTFLKTLFFGKFVGKDSYGNMYYKSKKDERWVVYQSSIEASKITSEWFLWMHHTINEIPAKEKKQYLWQKKHLENQTGTINSYKPNFISKLNKKKKKYDTWEN
ncbi:NADH-ubiquinone oxidoreductase subunit NDUFA12 family protein [Pelagibacteraceae bacterium]|nr:NADH-ubiquinone oxidoreductase subunit NDUFA12 family protein [Pelagibacteraceae bacterium]